MFLRFSRFLVCLVLGVVILLSGCAGAPGAVGPPGPAAEIAPTTLVIVPMSGQPKTGLTFYGSGFVPGEKVRVIQTIDEVPYSFGPAGSEEAFTGGGVVTVNEEGAFKLISRGGIPKAIAPGVYTVEAIGDKGSRATAPLEVLEKE